MTTERRRGTRIPARAQIMGWLLLVLVVVLTTVVLLARQYLHNETASRVTNALEQETTEFVQFASTQRDPRLLNNPEQLFHAYLERQYPDASEALIGVWRSPTRLRALPQAQRDRTKRIAETPALLREITTSERSYGTAETPAGPMRWSRVRTVTGNGEPAWFVTGHFTADETAQTNRIVQTLLLVGGIGVVLAAIAAWIVAGAILAPVRQVRRTAAEIGERDLTQRIPVQGRDDIAALAEQFNAMLDRLQEAFATQRQFVDDASHELRTPITIVRGNLELLGSDPVEREEVVRLCTDELDRMTRIVEDLLVLAKVDRPDFVTPEPISLVELTSDVDSKVRTLGDRRWILENIGEGDVTVDRQRLTQAVVQLAQNAVQHTEQGSEIRIGSVLDQGELSLWVTDSGPGVDPDKVEMIFERFTHGSGEGRGGAGLGLSIVRAIAEAHHGRVRVRTGDGTTFVLELPAAPTSNPTEES
ncbi:signal transduction histidine kinase [Saccharopolyspora lacisalsi]|uniref:histidine kinase n=1 Tax=Halosaccharopolyspora lacisalsi TaxID=1000566 RepID=A0A839E068_9PSEU|nr:ATP-binding protein [Halosaccharopolyspora lacisalsi]MBA8827592.1 signal transduction histidine kinase [Halosaccharopolyspora lacisalsi]